MHFSEDGSTFRVSMLKAIPYICILTLAACGVSSTPMRTTAPADSQVIFIDPSVNPLAGIDPFNLKDAQQIGDFVVIDVSYSGGCEEHEFQLETRSEYTATYPPEVNITLKHNSNGDRCRGMMDTKLWFDLSPLKYNGTNRIILVLTNTDTTLDYNY
ncbi:MAG: hypothetical protein ACI9CP_001102 [Cryomorphaceae bacterium]|jgi:hypothetical protein